MVPLTDPKSLIPGILILFSPIAVDWPGMALGLFGAVPCITTDHPYPFRRLDVAGRGTANVLARYLTEGFATPPDTPCREQIPL
jgi:hypothetical protein